MIRLFAAALLLVPSLAAADRVTVKGAVLEGTVKSISGKEIVMKTIYGKGDLTIPTADVTAIETDAPFHVYQADDGQTVGPIVGITPEVVSIAEADGRRPRSLSTRCRPHPATPARMPTGSSGDRSRARGGVATRISRSRRSTRAFTPPPWRPASACAASEDRTARASARATCAARPETRRTTPDTIDVDESDTEVTGDELRGSLRHEYDLTARLFAFGSLDAEHDGIEALALRAIPKLGAGYKIVDREDVLFSVDTGFAYVYQKYFGGDTESYTAIAFGAESDVKLPFLDATWHARADYLPSLTNWTEDYFLRGETALLIPIYEQLSLKAALIDEYNSQPADDTVANSLTTLLGLSLVY